MTFLLDVLYDLNRPVSLTR